MTKHRSTTLPFVKFFAIPPNRDRSSLRLKEEFITDKQSVIVEFMEFLLIKGSGLILTVTLKDIHGVQQCCTHG
jgi:hypothetical protein